MIDILLHICSLLISLLGLFYICRVVYSVIGLFYTKKFAPAKTNHKYAVIIAARNEELVIGNLIDSIAAQDYPAELVTTFVVADNCTDATAAVARAHGALCYERTDPEHRTKGFALRFLFENIKKDFGIDSFEGYFIFDADNLLKRDFISRMNDAFDSGEKIITSYRNTKNFDDNWIAAGYGLHFLRTTRLESRARSYLNVSTWVQGCGFLIASDVVANGWNYTTLAEDRSFSADSVVHGIRISYQHEAEFYDEQPTSLKIVWRQRIRWAKGHLQAFLESGGKLFSGVFKKKTARERFMCYDMFTINFPGALFLIPIKLIKIALMICLFFLHGQPGAELFPLILGIFKMILFDHIATIPMAFLIFFLERRRIKRLKWYKILFYSLMFPMFSIICDLATCVSFFQKVTWKPIPHKAAIRIDEIEKATAKTKRPIPQTSRATKKASES